MKKALALVVLALALSAGLPAGAQQDPNLRDDSVDSGTITFTSPRSGSTVGTTFVITGSYTGNCVPDGLYMPAYVNSPGGSAFKLASLSVNRNQRTFTQQVDTRQPLESPQSPPQQQGFVQPGQVSIEALHVPGVNCQQTPLVLNIQRGQAAEASATAEPTPSPSPSVAPVSTTTPVASSNEVPDWVWVIFGALVGAVALAGAEYTAHAYRKKHPKAAITKR